MFTRFMDMHSGGSSKENQGYIYVEAGEKEARVIFYNRFGHSPDRVTCTCCGEDYSISEYESLELATAYDRACQWNKKTNKGYDLSTAKVSLEDYCKLSDVLVIRENEIKDSERIGDVPQEGYVWH